MREWRGLKVPCKPKKEWKKWMCGGFSTICCIPSCVGEEVCTSVTSCYNCVYSSFNGSARREFYQECFPEKPKKLPQRDSKGRFCKKGGVEMMYHWEGLKIPVAPKREWGEWMVKDRHCPLHPETCFGVRCDNCVYSMMQSEARNEFYEYRFGKWEKEELPELSEKAFHCPDCPVKAEYLTSDVYGNVWALREDLSKMIKLAIKCKPLSIIKREHKEAPKEKPSCENCVNYEPKEKLPKLTQAVFDRDDCPKWANWAAVDSDGEAAYYEQKPVLLSGVWRWPEKYAPNNRWQYVLGGKCFDASTWHNSLIERPHKELPTLAQTAFHCPECPKEATTLKVFPANHVVALDKNDKVLSVMELQCKEGEVSRVRADWYYNKEADILYYGKDFEYTEPPVGAVPVNVSYLPSDVLKGTAVHETGVAEDFLIVDVDGSLVTLVGVKGKNRISMVTLILNYRITCSGSRCCVIRPLQ